MSELTPEVKSFLLKLARLQIESKLLEKTFEVPLLNDRLKIVEERRGCFVTLHENGDLRGCIGTIEPVVSLMEGVRNNAVNAAFGDPRFSPLSVDELNLVNIEISVLSVPREITFKDGNDLKQQLKPGIHGVILSQGPRSSTFLPQVWSQLPGTETFLAHLCVKGGMPQDCWKTPDTCVRVYEAEYFSE